MTVIINLAVLFLVTLRSKCNKIYVFSRFKLSYSISILSNSISINFIVYTSIVLCDKKMKTTKGIKNKIKNIVANLSIKLIINASASYFIYKHMLWMSLVQYPKSGFIPYKYDSLQP